MAEWIPVAKCLPRKREVVRIASALNMTRQEVVGWLVEFWAWSDDETSDGKLTGMSLEMLPAVVGSTIEFWKAVCSQEWLIVDKSGIRIPNYDRWMGHSAKRRLQENQRRNRVRKMSASNADNEGASAPDKKRPTIQDSTRQNKTVNTTPNPLDESARKIVEHYQKSVCPDHDTSRGKKNVLALLKKGTDAETLMRCADGYAARCQEHATERKYRKAVGNFYGTDATFEEFLEWNGTPETKPMTDAERLEYTRKKYGPQAGPAGP